VALSNATLGMLMATINASILLSVTWMDGSAGALWLILMRVGQGVGGALLFANSGAILTVFASFLGYNPMATLLGPHVLAGLPPAQAHELTGRSFFPHLISSPFHRALVFAFVFAIAACLVAAVASLLRGGKYHHSEATVATGLEPVEGAA